MKTLPLLQISSYSSVVIKNIIKMQKILNLKIINFNNTENTCETNRSAKKQININRNTLPINPIYTAIFLLSKSFDSIDLIVK